MNETMVKFWVGVMVFSTMLIGAILILLLGNKPAIFEPNYTLYLELADAPGISKNTAIYKSGIKIGDVRDIKLNRDDVKLTAAIHSDVELPDNGFFRVRNTLFGDAVIDFILPPGERASAKAHKPNTTLRGRRAVDPIVAVANLEQSLSGAINSVSDASSRFDETLQKINLLIEKNDTHISSVITQTDETLKLVRETAQFTHDVTSDPEFQRNFKAELEQLPTTLRNARETMGQLKTTMQNMDHTMSLVDDNLENVRNLTEPLGENGRDIARNIDESVRRLNQLMVEMETFGKTLNSREGTLGRLTQDDELYVRLNRTVQNVEEITFRLKPIVNDVRVISDRLARHPGLILRDAVRPGAGIKGLPPRDYDPGDCTKTRQSTWVQ